MTEAHADESTIKSLLTKLSGFLKDYNNYLALTEHNAKH